MQPKTLKVLAGVFVALCAVWTLARVVRRSAPPEPLLWKEAKRARRIEIRKPDAATTLVKADAGWSLESPFKFAADGSAVEQLLEKLAAATLSEPLSSDPRRHADFNVDRSSALHLQGFPEGGEGPGLDLLIGRQGGDYDSLFVRRPGTDEVREARGIARYQIDKKAGEWADKLVCGIGTEKVTSIEIHSPGGVVRLQRKQDKWRLGASEEPLPPETVTEQVEPMLTKLSDLKADSVSPETELSSVLLRGLAKPELRVVVGYRDEAGDGEKAPRKSLELSVGPEDTGSRYPLRKAGVDGVVYQMPGWKLEPFRKKAGDFKKKAG
ncbi:MAG: DUF4340 domain-containing protein [Elusimicrobiota bacterium]